MNGDFLALLPKKTFPQLQDPDLKTARLEATTVFAFHCADGVLFAGDHRATAGNIIFSDKTEKILQLDDYSLLAIAGSPAIAFEMARTLQTAFEFYRRSQLQPMSLRAKTRALSQLLRENLPAALQGIGIVAPIFAGVDSMSRDSKKAPVVYFYDPLGADFEATNFAASGSGAQSIKSVLHYLEKWGDPPPAQLPVAAAVNLANRLLMTAAEYDAATGGIDPSRDRFGTIKMLSDSGIQAFDNESQRGFWND